MSDQIGPGDPDFLNFWEFFQVFVAAENLSLPLKPAHKEACDLLEDAILGQCDKEFIIVNIPPRIGKTKIMQALACWTWLYFPNAQMIYTSYSGDLAEESVVYIRQVLEKPWFKELNGGRDIVHGARSDHVSTMDGGHLYGEGTGGTLTGKGGGLKEPMGGFICIDDPAKPDEALSPVVSASVTRWFETTLKDRRNSDRHCPIIICAQRLAPMDLPGYVMTTYPNDYAIVKCKALLDDGTSAFPETISAKTLEQFKSTRIGRFVLASKYQQEPTSLGGNLIQTESFVRYDVTTARGTEWEEIIITVDTAMKTKEANDFSALEAWGKKDRRGYLLDLMHGKWESPELLANTVQFTEKIRADFPGCPVRVVIEEKAAGIGLIQQMNQLHVPAEGIERDIDKVRRVKLMLPFQESGCVLIPKDGQVPWLAKLLNECAEFKEDGTHGHDDMVDALCDGVTQLLGSGLSILDLLGSPNR